MYLNCKSYFSLRYGTIKTDDLVNKAAELKLTSLALTNINTTCDTWDFVDFCRQQNIKPVAGAEVRNDNQFLYILIARNNDGFTTINNFLSSHLKNKIPFDLRPELDEDVFIIYSLESIMPSALKANEYIGIQLTEVFKLCQINIHAFPDKFVIWQPVTFQDKKNYNAHRLLRAIDRNIILSKQDKNDLAGEHETFLPPAALRQYFENYPAIISTTENLLDQCSITLDFKSDKTKKLYSSKAEDDRNLLETLALKGMLQRYGFDNETAKERIAKELKIINTLGFNAYFLITYDIIQYAQIKKFFYVGRGSGANSIVAYCLQITDVDPIELDLYFERFLNPYRSSPPDFDIDFSWKDRDEIIQYIFNRYGTDRVCLLGSYTTFQWKAIIRELGKVFGLPKEEIDRLGENNLQGDSIQQQILRYGSIIKNFPNHLSIHAGGILISEEPLSNYTATELPPKGFTTSQIDMFVAEKIGLYKLDILSQRGLGHIKETVELIEQNQKIKINIHDVEKFKTDKKVAVQIRAADTIGCFYIESPAMRQLLKKLKCNDFITLVAASSIIRPGVSQSGMMKQYIYRYHNPDKFEYLHPKMKELLKETYGVMVYQEDVIKVAHHFAGLDMGEADVLRRAMSGKYRGNKQFEEIKAKFFINCKKLEYPNDTSKEIWRQIESFGGYSFSKAHSASFAVESYQSLFLKTYFPIEFMVAVINNFGGFYGRELYFHELSKAGAILHVPCVNKSQYLTSVSGTNVYIGFVHVLDLEEDFSKNIIKERCSHGNFTGLQQFIERLHPQLEQLNILIRMGSFAFTGISKKELLWQANFLQKKQSLHGESTLFKEKPLSFTLPVLKHHPLDDAADQLELLGFPLCNVFQMVKDDPEKYVKAKDLCKYLGKQISVLGYLVVSKPANTIKRERMYFHSFIDADGNWLDTINFSQVVISHPVTGKGFYRMTGKVVEDFGVFALEVNSSYKIGIREREEKANVISVKEPERHYLQNVQEEKTGR